MSYFDVLKHLRMESGYVLDYDYAQSHLGGGPSLTAKRDKPAEPARALMDNLDLGPRYLNHIVIDETAQGYAEFVLLRLLGEQFSLFWHANYNDAAPVCDMKSAETILQRLREDSRFEDTAEAKAILRRNIPPTVALTGNVADVELTYFTKWGGFIRAATVIKQEFPHYVLYVGRETIVDYDCGMCF